MDKNTIRIMVKDHIEKMSAREKQKESATVYRKLLEILPNKKFDTLVAYHAFDDEINISQIDEWCRNVWKNIIFIPQTNEIFSVPRDALIIVPGRAFTKNGQRIGRWSGYYDRIIAGHPDVQTIGVCFHCQVFTELPEDNWDQRMDEVVFDENTLE